MPPISYLFACEWCLEHFTQRGALVAHKLHSHDCRLERRRRLRYLARHPDADINDVFGDAFAHVEGNATVEAEDVAQHPEGLDAQPSGGSGSDDDVETEEWASDDSDYDDGASSESDDDASSVDDVDFKTALEFFHFVVGCNGGEGLSNKCVAWLFKILRDPCLDLDAIRRWRTKRAVLQYGLRLMMARRVYRTEEVRIPGVDHTFEVMLASIVEAFTRRPNPVLSALTMRFSMPGNIVRMICRLIRGLTCASMPFHALLPRRPPDPLQAALDALHGEGQVVAPIILSSDATILSGNERVKVWAVYLSLANIHLRLRWGDSGKILLALLPMPTQGMTAEQKVQLFQAAMQIVLADLIVASHTWVCFCMHISGDIGIAARDPWGVDRVIWPILFSYVADFPETCKVSCTQQHGSAMPCSLCYVDRGHLRCMTAAASEPRTVDQQSSLLHNPRLARTYSTLCIPSFLWEWNFARTVWGNTYLSQMPDILHIIYLGFWLYLRAALHGPDSRAATLDEYVITPGVISSRTIVAFLDWHETYVRAAQHTDESLSMFGTATRRMVQLVESTFPRDHSGWNLVKVHLLLHLTEAFRRGGLPREYSAAVYENAHIRTCKRPYRASNHRDLRRAIAQHNTNTALLTHLPTNLEGDRQYNTALRRAIAAGLPQLCRQRYRLLSDSSAQEQAPLGLYATYDAAIPGGIGPYEMLCRLYGYIPFPAWVHTALALPGREMDYTLIRPHYARAAPSLHGAPAFSFIEYEDGSGELVHGRVHLLLTLTMSSCDADPAGEELAFVRRWFPSHEDECTGCMRMRPSDDELGYDFVPVVAVQRTVHMVESFVTPGLWFLNKWTGRCREEMR
ncbi:unnamed protein product [Closterium sp. Yama58-4]|nr:unnamed protein product [Closterium sp. Yama58-4]